MMKTSTVKISGALTGQDSELTLSAPSGDSAHCLNPSPWPRGPFLRFRNLRPCVVAVPWAECVRAWHLAGGGRGGDGSSGDGRGGVHDMGECMAVAMRGGARSRALMAPRCVAVVCGCLGLDVLACHNVCG